MLTPTKACSGALDSRAMFSTCIEGGNSLWTPHHHCVGAVYWLHVMHPVRLDGEGHALRRTSCMEEASASMRSSTTASAGTLCISCCRCCCSCAAVFSGLPAAKCACMGDN